MEQPSNFIGALTILSALDSLGSKFYILTILSALTGHQLPTFIYPNYSY